MTPFEKAERAKSVLADPVFAEAMSDIRMRLVAQLEAAAISDIETQHEITLTLQLLKRLREQLDRYVQDQAVVVHKSKQESFMKRMKRSLAP